MSFFLLRNNCFLLWQDFFYFAFEKLLRRLGIKQKVTRLDNNLTLAITEPLVEVDEEEDILTEEVLELVVVVVG
jgi:hypothetical protein